MNEKDLRVIKTKESIEAALLELLRTKPINKVTVAELSRLARINKGTFYLHYLDIFDLYKKTVLKNLDDSIVGAGFFSDFFDMPDRFMEQLDHAIMTHLPKMRMLSQGEDESLLRGEIINRLCDKVYETGRIVRSIDHDMKLDAIFGAMLSFMPKYYSDHKAKANALTVSLIRLFFPSESNQRAEAAAK